ncbi:MAG: PD-(D/E)XK nuclease family protein [Candidatus Methylomirabilaceae bacterium]
MEGVIDLVYRLGGEVWAADYKTDRVRDEEVASRAAEYHLQAKIYKEAVSRCLGVDKVGFQFLFLRNGKAVEV